MENAPDISFELLDVKISARVRKRGFTPWKAWRKQICSLNQSDNGLELWIYPAHVAPSNNTPPTQIISIPQSAVCYRTDSRTKPFSFGIFFDAKSRKAICYLAGVSETNSQSWIFLIRDGLHGRTIPSDPQSISISIIDNAHSRGANMFGVYGNISADSFGICIYNYHSEIPCAIISWEHILHSRLANNTGSDDDNKISIIHTSRDFVNGEGQLFLFCLQAPKLLNLLLLQGNLAILRGTSEQFAESHSTSQNRRLSRSEGDLCDCCESDRDSGWSSCSPVEYNSIFLFNGDEDIRNSVVTDDFRNMIKKKEDSNLLCKNDFFYPTKGCDQIDGFDQVSNLFGSLPDFPDIVNTRRTSGMSVASGIYEEIIDGPSINSDRGTLTALYEEPFYMPPPLPPRGRYTSLTSASDEGVDECEDCSCSTPTTAQFSHTCVLSHAHSELFHVYDSGNLDLISIQSKRKLSETSTHSDSVFIGTYSSPNASSSYENKDTTIETRFDSRRLTNSSALKKTVKDNIPRCNTAPEQNLKESQLNTEKLSLITKKGRSSSVCNSNISKNAGKTDEKTSSKSKSRFDLTPIRNKLNSFIKGNSENETPKTSKFYSLPRSFNNKKFTINSEKKSSKSKRKMYQNQAAKSCDILNTNSDTELADIDGKISYSAEVIDDQYMEMTSKTVVDFKTLPKIKNKYYPGPTTVFDSEYKVESHILTESSELYLHSATDPHQKQIIEILVNDNKILNCNSCQFYENIKPFESNNEEMFIEKVVPAQSVVTMEPRFSLMRLEWSKNKTTTELVHNGDYVPMSPGVGLLPQEDQYMEMTGLQKVNEEEPHYMTMTGSVKS